MNREKKVAKQDNCQIGKSPRLVSLDALRGFDLFLLVALGPLVVALTSAADTPALQWLADAFTHKDWEGFSLWDLVMPLFVFMSGASVPFALSRYRREGDWKSFSRRLLKRVALLWLFGMLLQGNLLALNPDRIYLFSNTLQSIAVGYAVAALLFMTSKARTQLFVFMLLLLSYGAIMHFVRVDGYGGTYAPDSNLAEWVDRIVLGRFRDGAYVDASGAVVFSPWYRYTWILSSLGFAATAISGTLAGTIAKSGYTQKRKLQLFFGAALLMLALGYGLSDFIPIIKKLWTSTMVLVGSGWSFTLMGIFYWFYDVRGKRTGLAFLRPYGLNSITAYMVSEMLNFRGLAHTLLFGFEQFLGSYYPLLLCLAQVGIVYTLLLLMHRRGIYLKV